MKKILFIFSVLCICSCLPEDDGNVNPSEVPASALFTNSTVSLMDFMASPNVNTNNFRLWGQQWAQTTYPDESNYELVERDVNGAAWNRLYATVIKDLREAKIILADDPFLSDENKRVQTAMMNTLEIYAFHLLVDIFGDVPYSESIDINNISPKYDDDEAIYNDLITRLDAVIEDLNGESAMGGADLIYGGNAAAWSKFANSLKLRLAIRIADKDDAKAKTMVESAVAKGVFTSSADDFEIAYQTATPNTNPLWEQLVQSGRSDFVGANTLVDVMNGLEDPRISIYFKENVVLDSIVLDQVTLEPIIDTIIIDPMTNMPDTTYEIDSYVIFRGGTYGDGNSFPGNSQPGALLEDPLFPGTIFDYTEVRFLLADAAERGYDVGGTAEEHYNAGVKNSIVEWGMTGDDADAYLTQADVAYTTAPGTWKEKIAMQKWIALYNRGFEAWSTYRVYNAPTMNVAVGAGTLPPMRFTYPINEYSLNPESVNAAGSAIGGDDLFTKVFWDMN